MTDALARYWQSRFAPDHHDPGFAADIARIHDALAAGHTVAANHSPADGVLRISLADALQGALAPIVVWQDKQWLYRTYHDEARLARLLLERLRHPVHSIPAGLDPHLNGLYPAQQDAIRHALTHSFTLITGGPGTGKTHTIARLVAILGALYPGLTLALAAPTGKAAKRMSESLGKAMPDSALPDAQTLHRLLGIGHDQRPQYHRQRPLPHDLVIIDEASMLSLELACALFTALAPHTRLVLIGDAGQLAAVDPGAVLHDLCKHPLLARHLVTLTASQRFAQESVIGRLAGALASGDDARIRAALAPYCLPASADTAAHLFAPYHPFITALQHHAPPEECLAAFDHYRILCAGHHGTLGTRHLNHAMRLAHLRALNLPTSLDWYSGKPVMVTANDYTNRLYNGDIGLCLAATRHAPLQLHFPGRAPLPLERINPAQLDDAYALTVHKSQGSEFSHIALALDRTSHPYLSRELLYTGITRARHGLSIHGSLPDSLPPTLRSTGLDILLDRIHQPQAELFD